VKLLEFGNVVDARKLWLVELGLLVLLLPQLLEVLFDGYVRYGSPFHVMAWELLFWIVLIGRLWSFKLDTFGLGRWEHRDRTSIYESIDMILNYFSLLDIDVAYRLPGAF
jgi:hypothetical protein